MFGLRTHNNLLPKTHIILLLRCSFFPSGTVEKDQVEYGAKHIVVMMMMLSAKKIMCLLHCCLFPKDQRLLNNNVCDIYLVVVVDMGQEEKKICNNTLATS